MHSSRMRTACSLPYMGVSARGDRDPRTEILWTQTPLDRDPLDRDPPRQRPLNGDPWTETLLDRDPLPVDRQMPVKILPCAKLRLLVGNNCSRTAILGSFLRVTHGKLHMDGTLNVHH